MTVRAVVLGLLGAALVCGVTYFNDRVVQQTMFVGNNMPYSVYGGLILFLLFLNPALGYVKKRWAFTGAELAVVLALTLAACAVPGSGLMRTMTNALMVPHHMARTRPGWQSEELIEMVPDGMLAGTPPELREDDVLDPRGLCLAMIRDGEGEATGPQSRVGARIWGFLSDADREAIREAAKRARAGPDEAVRALNGVLDRRDLYRPDVFEGVTLSAEADRILDREMRLSLPEGEKLPTGERRLPERIESLSERDLRTLNRHLVDSAWPKEIYGHAARRVDESNSFMLGKDQLRGRVSLGEIPWSAWVRPLVFWIPVILLLWIGLIGLAVVLHRQWSRHEHLSYPIARFANSLLPAEGEAKSGVFRNRMFWAAAVLILVIHMTNYAYVWKPETLVKVPTAFNFGDLARLFPTLERGGARWRVFQLRTYFTVVAVAYFVASDVSLSLGIGPLFWCYLGGILVGYGISPGGGGRFASNIRNMSQAGAYFGILIMILYTGRRYYSNVFRRAVFLRPKEEVEAQAVWGARVFLVCGGIFTVNLIASGLDWPFAIFYLLAAVVMFVVMGRMIAETGLFFMEALWFPGTMLIAFFGTRAVGPSAAIFMFLLSTILLLDRREGIMPFVVNSLKLLEVRRVRIGRTAIWAVAAIVLGLAVAVPVTLMFQYGRGTGRSDWWAVEMVPKFAFNKTMQMKQRLKAQEALEESERVRGWARFGRAAPELVGIVGLCAGLGLVLAFSAARLRLPWWPLHPVMFLAWSTYAGYMFSFSFLLGWFIKKMVTKYGGEKAYSRLKPVFFGLIAGDMLGGVIPSLIGAIYYMSTGKVPKYFTVLPG